MEGNDRKAAPSPSPSPGPAKISLAAGDRPSPAPHKEIVLGNYDKYYEWLNKFNKERLAKVQLNDDAVNKARYSA